MEEGIREKLLKADIDVEAAVERFVGQEKLFMKFLKKFTEDASYETFRTKMEAEQYDDAFEAAHALKGLCGNLSIDGLFQIVSREVEFLRNGRHHEAVELLPEVMKEYERVADILSTI